MKLKLVISRVKLCGDLRACYCQSCQRDKRITGEISSMSVNGAKLRHFFLDTRMRLAIQLNNDDRLSQFPKGKGPQRAKFFIYFCSDQVIV